MPRNITGLFTLSPHGGIPRVCLAAIADQLSEEQRQRAAFTQPLGEHVNYMDYWFLELWPTREAMLKDRADHLSYYPANKRKQSWIQASQVSHA